MKIDLDRLYLQAQNYQGRIFSRLEFYKMIFTPHTSGYYQKAKSLKTAKTLNPIVIINLIEATGLTFKELFFSID